MNHPKSNKKWLAAFCFGWLLLCHLLVNIVRAESPDLAWVHSDYSTIGHYYIAEVAMDSEGNSFAVGHNEGTAYFGTNKFASNWLDGFISKYDAAGNVLWVRPVSRSIKSDDIATTMTLDSEGNSYVAGYFNLSEFGTNTNPTGIGMEKYDPAGNRLWEKMLPGSSLHTLIPATGIAVDGADNIYLAGNYRGTVDFGGTSLTSSNKIPFLAKYDSSINLLWVIQPGTVDIGRIQLDGDGHLYAMGTYTNGAIFGGMPLTTVVGSKSSFLSKLDLDGNVLWIRTFFTPYAGKFGLDGENNCYVAGEFTNTLAFSTGAGTTNLTSYGLFDVFVAKYDHSGNFLWASSAGSTGYDNLNSAAVDKAGNIYLTGKFNTTNLTFGNITLPGQPTGVNVISLFLAKYNSSGQALWAKELKNGSIVYGQAIAVNDHQQCVLAGSFSKYMYQLGNVVLTNMSGGDYFITKLVDRPRLKIGSTGTQSLFSWGTNWPGHVLETTTDLNGGTWTAVTNTPGLSDDQNVVTVENPVTSRFFRLRRP